MWDYRRLENPLSKFSGPGFALEGYRYKPFNLPESAVKRIAYIGTALTLLASVYACEKERIVESTEYIERIEYVQLPGDTVYQTDTIFNGDTIALTIYDTVVIHDTVVTTQYVYDTVIIVDTVQTVQFNPNKHLAMAAMQFYTDQLVFELIKLQFRINGGWVLYISNFQAGITELSPSSYVLTGDIDYWTPAWDLYYPLEFSWKLTHTGGDPANPLNWRMDEPGATGAPYRPGLRLKNSANPAVGSGN